MKEIIDDNLSVDASKLQVSLAAGKDVGQRPVYNQRRLRVAVISCVGIVTHFIVVICRRNPC